MALSIDPATRVITIPKSDLTPVSGTLYVLNTESFRNAMNALLDDEDYIWMPDWAIRNKPVEVGGVTLAQTIQMINGYSITFDDSGGTDAYSVRLEGSNNNLFDIQNGILNQNLVQVIPTNSAGLTYSKQVEDTSFTDARIWYDSIDGIAGTSYPIGTPGTPVDSFADAVAITTGRTMPKRIHLKGLLTMLGTDDLSYWNLKGEGPGAAQLAITSGCTTTNLTVSGALVSGALAGYTNIYDGEIGSLTGVNGDFVDCAITGPIVLDATTPDLRLTNCQSSVAGTGTPYIDCNNATNADLSVRGYAGGIEVRNFSTAGSNASFDLLSGRVVLDATCTAGTIVIRGSGYVTDNSGVGCTVVTTGLTAALPAEVWDVPLDSHLTAGSTGAWMKQKLLTVSKYLGLSS